jgi:hypothetical protein
VVSCWVVNNYVDEYLLLINHLSGVMVSAWNTVDHGFNPWSGQTKDKQHKWLRTETGFLKFTIICPSGATCQSAGCGFSELAL